jgi:hypothetical protein
MPSVEKAAYEGEGTLDNLTNAGRRLGSHSVLTTCQYFRMVRQNLDRMNRTQEARGSIPLSSTEGPSFLAILRFGFLYESDK